ncbi:hypothetical protein PG997_010280 [Apiospora hydei]|uniref:Uncharacterized protein n=1 Tax=Apiospora hydei TaxID=1337664 RepID=A0ABR1VWK4_9PEZI
MPIAAASASEPLPIAPHAAHLRVPRPADVSLVHANPIVSQAVDCRRVSVPVELQRGPFFAMAGWQKKDINGGFSAAAPGALSRRLTPLSGRLLGDMGDPDGLDIPPHQLPYLQNVIGDGERPANAQEGKKWRPR